jgi:polyhydroxyalkanoate synthase
LRANDLIWHYVVDSYLKGRKPAAFDLLFWNSDGANLPGPMYAYYLRNMYLENKLRVADALTMCGVRVDVAKIALPSYVLATAEDHIVPWATAYASAQLLGKNVEFVLGASGHIAGVVNPLTRDRRSYRTGPFAASAAAWLAGSHEHPGSWWEHWTPWIRARSVLGSRKHPASAPAPGTYVRKHPEAARP